MLVYVLTFILLSCVLTILRPILNFSLALFLLP